MILYDEKTTNAIKSANRMLIPTLELSDDVTFKASFVISGDLHCEGKISALFDLIVFGDVTADEIEVKGRFVCMGRCCVSETIVVQNDIWAEDIRAKTMVCHDRITAQSVDADAIAADGTILVGKTLAVTEIAQTHQNVICGETAFGSGRIAASAILTAEPLDLDDGTQALVSPFRYAPQSELDGNAEWSVQSMKYARKNDYAGFLSELMTHADASMKRRLSRYLSSLKAVESSYPAGISALTDTALLIWLLEISHSEYFRNWHLIQDWTAALLTHFREIAEENTEQLREPKPAAKLPIQCSVDGFPEWLSAMQIMNAQRQTLGETLYNAIYGLLLSKLGLKPKFVEDRLKEMGWS